MDQQLVLQHKQQQQALPRLIEANHLLQMSSQSLEEVIAEELRTNPALELTEASLCPHCGSPLDENRCPTCRDEALDREDVTPPLEPDSAIYAASGGEIDPDIDPFSLIATEGNVLDAVRADAFASLPERDHNIAALIIESIDERGLLSLSVDELARMANQSQSRIEGVLRTVQSIAPPGVAARDLAECLALQANELALLGVEVPPVVSILTERDFADLAAHRYQPIAERHDTSAAEVQTAHHFIREQLTPSPLQDRNVSHWRHADSTPRLVPDVIVRITEDEIIVSLASRSDSRLAINNDYVKLSTIRRQKSSEITLSLSDDEWEHIRNSLRSARDFLSKLEQRRRTLLKIAALVCERQEAFLRGTVRDLVPLTRSEIASELNVNESTVSRATSDKFVMLPNRSVVPFADFFSASLGVKDVIRELIAAEAHRGQSLSDQRICDILGERGYRIARRTVTKYRLQLAILPSTQRRAGAD